MPPEITKSNNMAIPFLSAYGFLENKYNNIFFLANKSVQKLIFYLFKT